MKPRPKVLTEMTYSEFHKAIRPQPERDRV